MDKNKKYYTTSAPSIMLKLEEVSYGARITLFNIAHLTKLDFGISQGLLMEMGAMPNTSLNRFLNELEDKNLIKRETKYLQGNKGKKTEYIINWGEIAKYSTEKDFYKCKDNKNTPSSNAINKIEGCNFRYTQEELDFYEKFDIKPITDA